jgi:citrate lyase subunit beta/citryl-CoA lyase
MIFDDLQHLPAHPSTLHKAPCPHARHRSNMMLNPLNLKHLNRIDSLSADAITLNLEDAIAPARKREALENIALFLSHCPASSSRVIVRVNPLDRGGAEEILFLNDYGLDAVRLPKVRTRDEIERALALLPKDRELHLSIETAEAFRDLAQWRGIDTRLSTANLGILDLLADLDLPQSLLQMGNPTMDAILTRFLLDARTAGMAATGFTYQDYANVNEYEHWMRHLRSLGFSSGACMGPAQVSIANRVFDIDPHEIERALHIKNIFEKNQARDINGFMDDIYGYIDEPIYRDALNILKNIKENP